MSGRAWWYVVGYGSGVLLVLTAMLAQDYPALWLLAVCLVLVNCRLAQLAGREDRLTEGQETNP